MATHYLACDLGAESGRLMLGSLADGKLSLEELHRFPNAPVRGDGSLHWNIPRLFEELKTGLKKAAARGLPIASISTDSWGVDYLLFADDGTLLSPTFHYRDARCPGAADATLAKVPWEAIFAETGIQFMVFNTLFQLAAETRERLAHAARLLTIGDGFNYWLSGVACMDESNASTTQLYNPRLKTWSKTLISALGLPEKIFPPIVASGTRLGPLKPELQRETGLHQLEVIASCSHDTGAAVAAVPAQGKNWAYISSGTWSLMGVELAAPLITDACRELNFTNEIGFGGSIRLLKNTSGLWLVQECRRDWERSGHVYDYNALIEMALAAPSFVSLIDPADPRFLSPEDMIGRISAFCRETHQAVPAYPGAVIRCVLESLALLYRRTFDHLQQLLNWKIERLHIVGGGCKNPLLNQFTANALQRPVLAGPVEATAAGNALVQAIALGHLPSLEAGRAIVRASTDIKLFQPQEPQVWEAAYRRFQKLSP